MKQKILIGIGVLAVIIVVLTTYNLGRRSQDPLARNALTKVSTATEAVIIPVEGMSCMACAASVKKGLKNVQGVTEVEVSLEGHNAKVRYQTGKVDPELLAKTIDQLGYKAGKPMAENPK